eukprot:scaffold154196_cov52-Attheya_sp.AAC.1
MRQEVYRTHMGVIICDTGYVDTAAADWSPFSDARSSPMPKTNGTYFFGLELLTLYVSKLLNL